MGFPSLSRVSNRVMMVASIPKERGGHTLVIIGHLSIVNVMGVSIVRIGLYHLDHPLVFK